MSDSDTDHVVEQMMNSIMMVTIEIGGFVVTLALLTAFLSLLILLVVGFLLGRDKEIRRLEAENEILSDLLHSLSVPVKSND
ncbi:MAG: hypothetical protein ACKVJE_20225 [Pseudomonadales bacterium]